jgi:hypothetical protein
LRASCIGSDIRHQRRCIEFGQRRRYGFVGQLGLFRIFGQLRRHGLVRLLGFKRFIEVNEVAVPAIVDASKPFLIALSLSLSVAACNRSTSPSDQAESGVAAPPADAANTAGSKFSVSSGRNGSDVSIGSRIDDSVITTKVKAALMRNGEIKGSDISVETRNGEVALSGFVDSAEQGEKAIDAVWNVDGVKAVESKLAIRK